MPLDRTTVNDTDTVSEQTHHKLLREVELFGRGVGAAFGQVVSHPTEKLPELVISSAVGAGLGAVSRLGAPGRYVAAGAGLALAARAGYDEITNKHWSGFAHAVKDTWKSGVRMEQNVGLVKDSLGTLMVDAAVGYAAGGVSSYALGKFAPPEKMVGFALNKADHDGGSSILALENRFESGAQVKHVLGADESKFGLEYTQHSQPAVPGEARGDVVRVLKSGEDIVFASMDVEGHGLKAARKALIVHSALTETVPAAQGKHASEMLGLIDSALSSKDELSVTAALAKYNLNTHDVEVATASSQLAFLVRHNREVQWLGGGDEGLALGVDMYGLLPAGNQKVHLDVGDSVIMLSDGVSDRFGFANPNAFADFLRRTGANPDTIKKGILRAPVPETGADDTSFLIFGRTA